MVPWPPTITNALHLLPRPRTAVLRALHPLLLLLLLAAWICGPSRVEAQTLASDKQALLLIKAGILNNEELLQGWNESSDPCEDGWPYISCSCSDVNPPLTGEACVAATGPPTARRVLIVSTGRTVFSQRDRLDGVLSLAFAGLTALRVLQLANQQLQGTIPGYLQTLTELTELTLEGNMLEGSLPAWPGLLSNAQDVKLGYNNFSGPLPLAWCLNKSTPLPIMHVQGNTGLCGPVPSCLQDRIFTLNGTALINPDEPDANPAGGICDATQPTCDTAGGCYVVAPQFWTNISLVQFNFTPASDPESGIRMYAWGVGSRPGIVDVIPLQPFNGTLQELDPLVVGNQTLLNLTGYVVEKPETAVSLVHGKTYYVTLVAENNAAGRLQTNASSGGVVADVRPPDLRKGGRIYNGPNCTFAATQSDTNNLWLCWDPFDSGASPEISYSYQVLEYPPQSVTWPGSPDYYGIPVTNRIPGGDPDTSVAISNLSLQLNKEYFLRVYAKSSSGMVGSADSPPIRIVPPNKDKSRGIFIGVFGTIGALLPTTLFIFLVFCSKRRKRQRMLENKAVRLKALKALMYSLVPPAQLGGNFLSGDLRLARELAFVMTDVQASTTIARTLPHLWRRVQEIHDMVMREGISRMGGYEIATEGDAFQIAFPSVAQAVQFCMETQYRLLETKWPKELLRLQACKEERSPTGQPVFRGLRVRMGVHYAVEGTLAHRLHPLTKHRIFGGPGYQVAGEVADSAMGGQVVMTHDAWLRLYHEMPAAGFPSITQLGYYTVGQWPDPVWVYQVSQLLGRPLRRTFGPLRKAHQIAPGHGYNIVPAPPFCTGKVLTFAAARLELPAKWTAMQARETAPSAWQVHNWHPMARRNLAARPTPSHRHRLPPGLARKLYEVLAVTAMQFEGYLFDVNESLGVFQLAFPSTLSAVRFCCASQGSLMYARWPADAREVAGPTEFGPDGRLIFGGPRVAMAVHTTDNYQVEQEAPREAGMGPQGPDTSYKGSGVRFADQLSEVTHGGQVVVSETAWADLQDHMPPQTQVYSLGTHRVHPTFREPTLLLEVMPHMLSRRSFPPLLTQECLEKGYRDSPDPDKNMAIVFVRASKPVEVSRAEAGGAFNSPGEAVVRPIEAYHIAVGMYTSLVRAVLPAYQGYECKEPEPGKLTLAFESLTAAVSFCVETQRQLLMLDWPSEVLTWHDCCPSHDSSGRLIWRGLRVRMGMAYGKPTSRMPLNTGRADYFGPLPNMAARVMAMAAPGQILLESGGLVRCDKEAAVQLPPCPPDIPPPDEAVHLQVLGAFVLRGLEEESRTLVQAVPESLSSRKFENLKCEVAVATPLRRSRAGLPASFISSASGDSRTSARGKTAFTSLARIVANLMLRRAQTGERKDDLAETDPSQSKMASQQASAHDISVSDFQVLSSVASSTSPWGSFLEVLRRVPKPGVPLASNPASSGSAAGASPLHSLAHIVHPRRPPLNTLYSVDLDTSIDAAAVRQSLQSYTRHASRLGNQHSSMGELRESPTAAHPPGEANSEAIGAGMAPSGAVFTRAFEHRSTLAPSPPFRNARCTASDDMELSADLSGDLSGDARPSQMGVRRNSADCRSGRTSRSRSTRSPSPMTGIRKSLSKTYGHSGSVSPLARQTLEMSIRTSFELDGSKEGDPGWPGGMGDGHPGSSLSHRSAPPGVPGSPPSYRDPSASPPGRSAMQPPIDHASSEPPPAVGSPVNGSPGLRRMQLMVERSAAAFPLWKSAEAPSTGCGSEVEGKEGRTGSSTSTASSGSSVGGAPISDRGGQSEGEASRDTYGMEYAREVAQLFVRRPNQKTSDLTDSRASRMRQLAVNNNRRSESMDPHSIETPEHSFTNTITNSERRDISGQLPQHEVKHGSASMTMPRVGSLSASARRNSLDISRLGHRD